MKTKFLLASCVLAAAVAGCQNEEFEAVNVGGQAASDLVEVGDNFMISGVGAVAPGTRTQWVEGTNAQGKKVLMSYFTPVIPMTGSGAATNTTLGSTAVIAPTIGACALVGGNVYSNYEFYHYGWLATGQNSADFSDCPGADGLYDLDNGWLYDELTTGVSASSSEDVDAVISWTGNPATMTVNLTGSAKAYNGKSYAVPADVNLNSGIYKTENKAMFKGDYVLYYPYNDQFTEGMIPATSKVAFNDVEKEDLGSLDVAENTFRYAYAPDMVGGTTAASFEFKNLSGIVKITVKEKQGSTLSGNIEKLMLYSEKDGFLTKVYLDPSAIAAGKEGTEIYASGNKETNKTILVNMETASNKLGKDDVVYISALPTTVSDLVVYAYANNKWAACEVGNFEIKAGTGVGLEVTYADDDFEDVYLAVDDASLREAITNIGTRTEDNPATIRVIGDITLATTVSGGGSAEVVIPPYVTVEGDKIIVPEDGKLSIDKYATIASDVEVQGQSCCGSSADGGHMWVRTGATVTGNINVLAGYEDKLAGTLTFSHVTNPSTPAEPALVAADAVITSAGNVQFNTPTDIRGTLVIDEDATATVNAVNADVNVKGGKIENNGTFEVEGKFAMLDANGQTEWAAGQNFTNNGTFIDHVGATVGGATQNMKQNGTYLCKVDSQHRLDIAYTNKTACSVIEFINTTALSYDFDEVEKHGTPADDVDIIVSSASGVVTTFAGKATGSAATIGNLTVSEGAELTVAATLKLAVAGDIKVVGTMTTANNMVGMTANNMTIVENGSATFGERNNVTGTTLAVSNTIDVQQGGTLTLTGSESNGTIALVTCTKLVEGGSFPNGKPEVVASAAN